ncbi:hypothetical protein HYT52_03075 [Candidatus Woesearchaeota archaeon]|nr:hypothetical protein [Candidatus Woesearchaeota archaeon]
MATTKSTVLLLLGFAVLYCGEQVYKSIKRHELDALQLKEGYQRICSDEGSLELVAATARSGIYTVLSPEEDSVDYLNPAVPSQQESSIDTAVAQSKYLLITRYDQEGRIMALEMYHSNQAEFLPLNIMELSMKIDDACKGVLFRKMEEAYSKAAGGAVIITDGE